MLIHYVTINNYRAFGPTDTRIPQTGDFSDTVNIFCGPNGSGKTTILNALKLLFGRDADTTQAPITVNCQPQGDGADDHFDHQQKWSVSAKLNLEDIERPIRGILSVGRAPGGKIERLTDAGPVTKEWGASAKWTLQVRDRGFPPGWPRRLERLEDEAFKAVHGKNSDFLRKRWKVIQDDSTRYLGVSLGDPGKLLDAGNTNCPICLRERPLPPLGRAFRDRHNVSLIRCSDGEAHFLYLILEIRKHPWPTAFFVEEPEVYLHPELQKAFLDYACAVAKEEGHQFFITTHSPYLMNTPRGRLYATAYEQDRGATVKQILSTEDHWRTLALLGHRPADALHPNGVIWVEGASDAIYLKCWLESCARERGVESLPNWGIECEIIWFGGAGLADIGVGNLYQPGKHGRPALLDVLDVCRNAAVVFDADANLKDDRCRDAKDRIEKDCDRRGIFCWRVYPNTMEDCVLGDVGREVKPSGWPPANHKTEYARRYAEVVSNRNLRDIVTPEAANKVRKIYGIMRRWNGR